MRSDTKKKQMEQRIRADVPLSVIYKDIQKDLERVEQTLKTFAESNNKLIAEVNSYIFEKKGKRIRPALLLLAANLMEYAGDEHIETCSLVEALHTASLIHDDIIDNSDLRRGKKTVHARWGANITVLLGDYLYIKTIGRSLSSSFPEIVRVLTDTSIQMIEGELLEYSLSRNLDITEEQYFEIIYKKTAALFAASVRLGGILGGADKKKEGYLEEYGAQFGMAFQIIDDLLDYTGDEKKLGKPVLSDLTEGRITLPLIYSLNNGNKADRREIRKLIQEKESAADYKQRILSLLRSNGSLDKAYQKAESFSRAAQEAVSHFPESDFRRALTMISDYILTRNQ
ncbi:MAG: polyprenyl synthetase family protein [Acidobacteriota bacterium]